MDATISSTALQTSESRMKYFCLFLFLELKLTRTTLSVNTCHMTDWLQGRDRRSDTLQVEVHRLQVEVHLLQVEEVDTVSRWRYTVSRWRYTVSRWRR